MPGGDAEDKIDIGSNIASCPNEQRGQISSCIRFCTVHYTPGAITHEQDGYYFTYTPVLPPFPVAKGNIFWEEKINKSRKIVLVLPLPSPITR